MHVDNLYSLDAAFLGMLPRLEGEDMNLLDLARQAHNDSKVWFPDNADDLQHHILGLCGEAGEVANIAKKIDRGTHDLESARKDLAEEVIDVVIYAMNICAILGVDPNKMWDLKRAKNKQRFTKEAPDA